VQEYSPGTRADNIVTLVNAKETMYRYIATNNFYFRRRETEKESAKCGVFQFV